MSHDPPPPAQPSPKAPISGARASCAPCLCCADALLVFLCRESTLGFPSLSYSHTHNGYIRLWCVCVIMGRGSRSLCISTLWGCLLACLLACLLVYCMSTCKPFLPAAAATCCVGGIMLLSCQVL